MAAATAAGSSDSDTQCSVCHELFKKPKLLPCAHILCRHCLLSWLAANPEALCPLCRDAIVDPKEKSRTKGWEEVVDALPDDVAMAALVESTRVLSQDHVCVGCKSGAVSICLTCHDMMCKPCGQSHTNFSVARHHQVADLSGLTAEELAASQPDHCSVHTSKPCELFCPTHGAALCHLCASAKHRACPDLTDLAEAADRCRQELSQMVTSLLEEERQLDEAVAALERHLEATEKAVQEVIAEIDRTCDRLDNSVKACRRRLKDMTLEAGAKVKDTVLAIKVTLLDRRGRLTSHRRVADRTTRGSTDKGMCDVTGALKVRWKDLLDTCGQYLVNWKSVSMVTLSIGTAAVTRIENELSVLGEVKVSLPSLSTQLIRIDKVDVMNPGHLTCGVVLTDPGHLSLPDTVRDGWGSEAVVISWAVFDRGQQKEKKNELPRATHSLPEGSRVGLVVTSSRNLHLYVNGSDRGVIATALPSPCFAFFELWWGNWKASVLPPTHLG